MRPADTNATRALYAGTRTTTPGRGVPGHMWRPGVLVRSHGYAVTMPRRFKPYAISRFGRGRARHSVRAVYLAWRRGRPVGMLVVAWCGARLHLAELVGAEASYAMECCTCPYRRCER